jgi:hypothetical protein
MQYCSFAVKQQSQIILKIRQATIISAQIFDTIMTISVKFGLIWFSGFRGEDKHVNVYDGRTTTNAV